MKPVLAMEGGKTEHPVTVVGLSEKSNKSTTKKLVVGVVVGLVALVVVSGIILTSVYIGMKMSADSHKTARQTFRANDGTVVEEETTVTDTEVDVRMPNEGQVIYDYKHGLVVHRFTHPEYTTQSACYAHFMNQTKMPVHNPTRRTESSETDVMLNQKTEEHRELEWKITEREVPLSMVSESVAKMCQGTQIYFMEITHDSGISKRQTGCVAYVKQRVYIPYTEYDCAYHGIDRYYCVDTDGNIAYLGYIYIGVFCNTNCDPGANNPVCP